MELEECVRGAYATMDRSELQRRVEAARELMERCRICPRSCGVNRLSGEVGGCGVGSELRVASINAHYGEEPPISGTHGSGTVFFSGCNLGCVYCQNYPISQLRYGQLIDEESLARRMVGLQERGCHNINLVTPSHMVYHILSTVALARDRGLWVPLVYNTSGYDSLESLRLLDGVVDIYLPDMRYSSDQNAWRYSHAQGYVAVNRAAVREMYRQVGPLVTDEEGIALRGLIVRHLVLPGGISGSQEVFRFISQEVGSDVPVSLMDQYFPCYRAASYPEVNRAITATEYHEALWTLEQEGLKRGWMQEHVGCEE